MPTATTTTPLKFNVFSRTKDGYIIRHIEVKPDSPEGWYAVHVSDVISSNTQNHGLLTGDNEEPIAHSRLQEVAGA